MESFLTKYVVGSRFHGCCGHIEVLRIRNKHDYENNAVAKHVRASGTGLEAEGEAMEGSYKTLFDLHKSP